MGEKEVMELLEETEALLSGHFLLSSGLHSPRYIQCARLLQYPWHAERIGRALAEKVRSLGPFGAVVGPALGGILVAHELGRALGVRALFVEREGQRFALRRGFALALGERVLIAEDVVTTGGSTLETAEVVVAHGGQVVAAACIVDRRAAPQTLPFPVFSSVQLPIPTYPPEACPLCRAGVPLEKPGSRPRG
jgi:orotate phosphoribosyltransferase